MIFEIWLAMSLGSLLAGAATIVAVTYLVTRYWDHIISWFQERSDIINTDESKIAFTLKEKMVSGECAFVQGIFDKKTDKLEDVRRVESQQVDDELRKIHAAKTLAIYQ